MWEKTRFHFVDCHIEEIPGWATDGRVHKCILKYAYEIGSDTEISGFDVFVVQFGCWPYYRPAQLAELPRSEFDPELFPHSSYVKICETFATNVPYLTFCNIM